MIKSYLYVEIYSLSIFNVCLLSIDYGALATFHKWL